MRTKILKYFGMVVVLIIMVNLTSCEVSIESWYDDDDYSEIYYRTCLLYTSPSPRDYAASRMPSSA